MKKLDLTVGQIIGATLVLNEVKGGIIDINMAMKILDRIELTEEEKKTVGLEMKTPGTYSWTDEKFTKVIELSDDHVKLLVAQIKEKKDFTVFGGKYVVQLAEKIDPEMLKEDEKK